MSDQHTATTLTAAAVIAAILVARVAARHADHARNVRPLRRDRTPDAAPANDLVPPAVREAEQHVHRCWQRLQTQSDPPD
jgi:hypothetical protein